MARQVDKSPVFVQLMAFLAVAMLAPTIMASAEGDFATARAFLHGAGLLALFSFLLFLTTRSGRDRDRPRDQLLTLLGVFVVLPVLAAVPFQQAVGGSFLEAVFEMVSAMTTTGATLLDQGQYVPRAAHLWRAEVAWLGGLFMLVSAAAILAPMNLGGFEVRSPRASHSSARQFAELSRLSDPAARLRRLMMEIGPIYAGLTFVLFLGLMITGEDEFVALSHAMSVLSTSGISPVGGMMGAQGGFMGEALILLFMLFALSRSTMQPTILGDDTVRARLDPELRLGLLIILGATLALFLRHWVGSRTIDGDPVNGLRALWGTLFTVTSFLSTTGFESDSWFLAAFWSGLKTPGLALIGLAVIGGGVATTAGGVKLMRVYALGRQMQREVQQLMLPNSVGGQGKHERRIRRQGAYIAWVLFMLFALSVAAVMLALSLTGVQFETSMVLTVAALANCGPLTTVAAEAPLSFAHVPGSSQVVLAVAMVVGRLEALALIALFNPELWRK